MQKKTKSKSQPKKKITEVAVVEKPLAVQEPNQRKIIVVLERAGLDYSHLKKHGELLNHEDHAKFIKQRLKRDPVEYHPEIVHQCLLHLLDSPLNKSGLLQIFINTLNNRLIEVNPHTRIPRTYHRFSPLMAQLLRKEKIKAPDTNDYLLRVIKGPVTEHLPEECLKVAASTKGRIVKIAQYAQSIDQNRPIVFVIGAVEKGNPSTEVGYTQDSVSISKYPLTAAYTVAKILIAFETLWKKI